MAVARGVDCFKTDPGMWPTCSRCGGYGIGQTSEYGASDCPRCGGLGIEQPRDERGRFAGVVESLVEESS